MGRRHHLSIVSKGCDDMSGGCGATTFFLINIKAMIIGAHSIIYSANAEADKEFFLNVLKLSNVDVGGGWLIFGLPPSEVAVHPSSESTHHEFYLMVDDIETFSQEMNRKSIRCTPVEDQGWGLLTELTLPGGGKLGVYQPRHARPEPMNIR